MKIDEQTFKEYYDKYFESICHYLNYYTQNSYIIEEVVQEVFVKLWEERDKKEIIHINAYLHKSAYNKMLNFLRDSQRRVELLEDWAKDELQRKGERDCVDRESFMRLCQEAIDTLPEKCREIYLMSREMKLSYKEIAKIQSISVKTIENQMGTALKRIRQHILSNNKQIKKIFYLLLFI